MNKFQKGLHFRSYEDVIHFIDNTEVPVVNYLRNQIFDCIPNVIEHISYNTLFYKKKKNICFIWPSSIPWGGIEHGVSIGFVKGKELYDPGNFLDKNGRKNVATKVFYEVNEIEEELLREFLFQASELDQ